MDHASGTCTLDYRVPRESSHGTSPLFHPRAVPNLFPHTFAQAHAQAHTTTASITRHRTSAVGRRCWVGPSRPTSAPDVALPSDERVARSMYKAALLPSLSCASCSRKLSQARFRHDLNTIDFILSDPPSQPSPHTQSPPSYFLAVARLRLGPDFLSVIRSFQKGAV